MMKQLRMIHVYLVIVMVSMFTLSLSGWAQPGNVEPGQGPQFIGPPEQIPEDQNLRQGKPIKKGPDQADETSGIRINWRALNLTEEQLAQIKQYRRSFQINSAGMREELKFVQQDLREEIEQATADRAKIDQLVSELSNLKQRLSEAAVQNILAIKSVLTQEQLNLLAEQQARLPRELQRLKLSSEQKTQIWQIMKDFMKKTRGIEMELQDLKLELRETLLSSSEVGSSKLGQLQADIAEKELALEKARIDQLVRMREVLTPEQIERYKQVREKRAKIPAKRK